MKHATDVLDYTGKKTAFKSVEIASDNLGVIGKGGILLIHPQTLETVQFDGGNGFIAAQQAATEYAINNSASTVIQEAAAGTESAQQLSIIVQPPQKTGKRHVNNVAKLLYALNLQEIPAASDQVLYVTVKNAPYMDLVIEGIPAKDADGKPTSTLTFTHYRTELDGERTLEAEMEFNLDSEGTLSLLNVASLDPARGGELRSYDPQFANLFSKNLLNQGFDAPDELVRHSAETPEEMSEAVVSGTEDDYWLNAPANEFKEHLTTLPENDASKLLIERFAPEALVTQARKAYSETPESTNIEEQDSVITTIRQIAQKKLDNELTNDEVKTHGTDSRSAGYDVAHSNSGSPATRTPIHQRDIDGGDQTHLGQTSAQLARSQQHDATEESGVRTETVPERASSSEEQQFRGSSRLSGEPNAVRIGDALDASSDDFPVNLSRKEILLDLNEASSWNTSTADTYADAINRYLDIKGNGREVTNEDRQVFSILSGSAKSEIFSAFDSFSYSPLIQALHNLKRDDKSAYQSLKSSVTDSYYTRPEVIRFMWAAIERMGLNDSHAWSITEPSVGSGRFIGYAPKHIREVANITAVEKDAFISQITQWLYPDVKTINSGYEKLQFAENSQDLVIGNPPYGDFQIYDKKIHRGRLAHDFFLKRSIEIAKPGGMVAFITSSGTLDKKNASLRKEIYRQADLISAIRLPNTTFEDEGARVTPDILIFRKRKPGEEPLDDAWINTKEFFTDIGAFEKENGEIFRPSDTTNEYFLQHPEHVLGNFAWQKTQFGLRRVVEGNFDETALFEQLNRLPTGGFAPSKVSVQALPAPQRPDFSEIAVGSYIERDGQFFIAEADRLVPYEVSTRQQPRLSGQIKIRDQLTYLLDCERNEDVGAATKARRALNDLYDAYVKRFGPLNGRSNKRILVCDPSRYLVLGLEHLEHGQYQKSDIFSRPFEALNPSDSKENITNTWDALAFSLNNYGAIDEEKIGELINLGQDDLKAELEKHCFRDPQTGAWQLKEIYLSGHIYNKLKTAEAALPLDPSYQRNIDALKEVIPTPVTINDIHVRLGAQWIPQSLVREFIASIYRINTDSSYLNLGYSSLTGWKFGLSSAGRNWLDDINLNTLGMKSMPYHKLIDLTLNLKRPVVRDADGGIDHNQTELAKAKQRDLIERFQQWILSNPERSKQVQDRYNEIYNSYREAQFDGSFLTFPGMSGVLNGRPLKLHPHQPSVIARLLLTDHGALIAHEAGAGKTIEQIASAMEMKRLGMAKKPLVAVPNHMLDQFTLNARELYPNARILTATPEDFQAMGRASFAAKCRLNDWDLVICTHSMFGRMAVPEEFAKSYVEEEIEEYETAMVAQDDRVTLRALEAGKKRLEARLEKLVDAADQQHDDIDFGECGFDTLFYDEGHYLKNYAPPTSLSNVAGVNTSTSTRALDAVMKADYIRQLRGDNKGVYLATGTPITNSVSEIWVMLRIAHPDILRELGLYSFDAFAANFCEIVEHVEVKPEGGGYQTKERLSKFHNLPELIRIFRQVADIKTGKDLNLPRPDKDDIMHVAPQSEHMKMFMDWLGYRASAVRLGIVEPEEDNLLAISSAGRLASLDLRLIDPDIPDDPHSKINECVNEVFKSWEQHLDQKGTQLIFLDRGTPKVGFNLYDDIKSKLALKGIPEDQIAFIHDAKNDAQREELFARMRAGEIRVLLASTDKAGVGTNVQTLGTDVHLLDIPWRPTDLEQRIKRFERQGNIFGSINVHYYTTQDSFDLFMLETVKRKLQFITQAMSNPEEAARSLEEDVEPTLQEIMAITTGDPLIRQKVEVDMKVDQLTIQVRAEDNKRFNAIREKHSIEQEKATAERIIESWMNVKESLHIDPDNFSMSVDTNHELTSFNQAGLFIHKLLGQKVNPQTGLVLGELAGYPLKLEVATESMNVAWEGPITQRVKITKTPNVFIRNLWDRIVDCQANADSRIERFKSKIPVLDERLADIEKTIDQPNQYRKELDAATVEQIEINAQLKKLEAAKGSADKEAKTEPEFQKLLKELRSARNIRESILTAEEISAIEQQITDQPAQTTTRMMH